MREEEEEEENYTHKHNRTTEPNAQQQQKIEEISTYENYCGLFDADSDNFTCLTRGMINGSEIIGLIGRRASIFSIFIDSVFNFFPLRSTFLFVNRINNVDICFLLLVNE